MANKTAVSQWDETAANNDEIDSETVTGSTQINKVDDLIRILMSQIAKWTGDDTIASATTTDLSTVSGQYVTITGTTTITGLGTVKAGWIKFVRFSGALTLTHSSSINLPGAANITTTANDMAIFLSEGSGNWRCLDYIYKGNLPYNPIDEDDMSSDSATRVPTQQSVKAYVDTYATPVINTPVATTSGTNADFTIPSTAKVIIVSLRDFSTDGTSDILLRLGDSEGIETSGYTGAVTRFGASALATANLSSGFVLANDVVATDEFSGQITLCRVNSSSNIWSCHGAVSEETTTSQFLVSGTKATSATLSSVRITTSSGDTFDSGQVNVTTF